MTTLKVSIYGAGEHIALMVESNPTAFMLMITPDEAEQIARGLMQYLAKKEEKEAAAVRKPEELC